MATYEKDMELKLWVEKKHGTDVWPRMWKLMLNLAKTPGKRTLWEMQDTRHVRCACVWAVGSQRHQQAVPITSDEGYADWWPVVVSTDPRYISGQEKLMPVLCLPLLENGSRRPWMTHPSRIVFMPNTEQFGGPGGAPEPPARTMEIKLWSPPRAPTAMELKLYIEETHGLYVWQRMWDIMQNRPIGMEDRYLRSACVWGLGQQQDQQWGPVAENEASSSWWPVIASTNPEYTTGGLVPVFCRPYFEGTSSQPWLTHPSRIVYMQTSSTTATKRARSQREPTAAEWLTASAVAATGAQSLDLESMD